MYENIVKSWFTTLMGVVIGTASILFWAVDEVTDLQAIGGGIISFILLFMRDVLSKKIEEFLSVIIERFKHKP